MVVTGPAGGVSPVGPAERRDAAVRLTCELLASRGLTRWRVRLSSRMRHSLGRCCHYVCRAPEIRLSTWHVETAPWDEVVDTVRHEVAHAVAGPGHGHDAVWRSCAVALGARPRACTTAKLERPPHNWVGRCSPGCEYDGAHGRYRAPARHLRYRCRRCRQLCTYTRRET